MRQRTPTAKEERARERTWTDQDTTPCTDVCTPPPYELIAAIVTLSVCVIGGVLIVFKFNVDVVDVVFCRFAESLSPLSVSLVSVLLLAAPSKCECECEEERGDALEGRVVADGPPKLPVVCELCDNERVTPDRGEDREVRARGGPVIGPEKCGASLVAE